MNIPGDDSWLLTSPYWDWRLYPRHDGTTSVQQKPKELDLVAAPTGVAYPLRRGPLQPYVVLGYFPSYGNDSHSYTMLHPLITPTAPVVMAARRAGCGLHELPIVPYVEHACRAADRWWVANSAQQRTGLPMTTIGAWGPASFDPLESREMGTGEIRSQRWLLLSWIVFQ